ncbi:hypothetical protein PMAYCL1PPCAC_04430, partial [Pristionchus mayeri]
LFGVSHACLGVQPAADVVKLPCTECIIEVSSIECGKTCHGHFEQGRNSLGCSIVTCPTGMVLAIEDEHGEFSLLNGLLCNSNRRWTGADWTGPTTVFAKCLPLCQSCTGIQKYNGDCPLDQCTDLAPPLLDEAGCAKMIPIPGYGLFARVEGQLRQTDYLECTTSQEWVTSKGEVAETLAISARPTPECALCSNLHFPRNLLKEFAYYVHDEPKIVPDTGCLVVTCSQGRQMLVSPNNEPLVAVSQLSCNAHRRWTVDADPNEFAFMNVVCGAPSHCAGCNLQVTTDFCPSENCEDLTLLQEYTDDECLQFSCEKNTTLYALSQDNEVLTASFIQCTRDWRWMTNSGVLLAEKAPTLGCGSGPLRCGRCPGIQKHITCPSGHVCHSAPPPQINKNGCAEIVCDRGVLQISGIPTMGEDTSLVCNYEREWSVLDAEGLTRIGEAVTANCAVEVNGGDLQPVDKLMCTSLTREWISESEDAYGENVKVACGAGPLKCTSCSNLTATELPCPQSHCLTMIEYSVETGCKVATCPRGQSLYVRLHFYLYLHPPY